jgi:hypothetical protein
MEGEEMDMVQEKLQVDLEDLKDLQQEVVVGFNPVQLVHNYLEAVERELQEETPELAQVVEEEVQEILILQ